MFILSPPVVIHRVSCTTRSHLSRLCATARKLPTDTRPRSETRCRDTLKQKVALFVAYDGANYHGLQRNESVTTLSDVIESALYKAGAISDENVGTLEKIKWQVAARTDRGVSAAGNVISAKLLFRRDECDRPDALSLMCGRINAELPVHVRLFAIRRVTASFSARTSCGGRWYEYLLPLSAFGESPSLETFNRTLEAFVGTHSFHNFTAGAEHVAPPRRQATRYITKAMCDEEPLWLGDSKWIRICLQGQSFLLHQIRKMISLALLTHLGLAPADSIERSFRNDTLINIPPAPSVGLFLDCCHFDWYNKRHRNVLPERISVSDFEEDRERFKLKYILPSIARRAAEEDSMGIYFRTVEAYPIEFT